ncbi:MAG: hypothetical protein A2Z99_01070 [Treponema sp. GWB1_62_6]|nr:MAG: hypothetical protein A2Z99_01070 [Treponema sp. GWB1_62_6]OHE67220.1 MAG: hypothetical protein A2001_05080 [Treponema sp. GWC1_61_84]HCM28487.1 hypothetical protein [Treponema sp.]
MNRHFIRRSSLTVLLGALSFAVFALDVPRYELGLGFGLASYTIDSGYSGPSIRYDNFPITGYATESESAIEGTTGRLPYSGNPFAINTDLLIRWPIGSSFAIAYSNRASFAFEEAIHRGDYTHELSPVLTVFGLTGVELEWYPTKTATGPWLSALAGITALDQPFCDGYFTQIGVGGGTTLGWRLARHRALALNVLYEATFIPSWTKDTISDLGGDLWGDASGFEVSAVYRFGIK